MNKINKQDNIIFYISPSIEHWIIGIVAWRITEQLFKPSIVLKDEWDKLVASCRSPEYFSIIEVLEKYKDLFITFGWHEWAAWFSIKKENFIEFKTKITKEINLINFLEHKKELQIDKVVRLDELWFNFLDKINIYKPYWIWNLKPLFIVENLDYIKLDFLWQARDHLRFTTKHWFKIFWFFMWDYYEQIKRWNKVHLIFDISEDSWIWNKNLMLKIVDLIVE
jgi:single-stranded-DNA-specific exonuclease